MGERRALVIASQCESLNLLSFLPEAAHDVADALLDPEVGGCVSALADGRRVLVDPTMVQLDDAVAEAFERASEDEATLFIALVGHGDYAADDFYFLTRDTTDPANSRNALLLAQRIKELLGRYSMLDGLVILLDTCHAGIAAQQAATRWIKIVGEAGKRFEVLTASDDRTAADGCFSRSLAKTLRTGRPEFGERVRCPDLKRMMGALCPTQTAVHLAFDGVRTVEKGDQGLWLAMNNSEAWRPLLDNPAAAEIERLTDGYLPPPVLGRVVGLLFSGTRCAQVVGVGADALIAALARPSVAEQYVPAKFLQAVLFVTAGQSVEQAAGELARQLRRSVAEFGPAEAVYLETTDVTGKDAFERAVLGPLRSLPPDRRAPITLAINVHTPVHEDRNRILGSLSELTEDPALGHVRLVLATRPDTKLPGATVVRVGERLDWADEDTEEDKDDTPAIRPAQPALPQQAPQPVYPQQPQAGPIWGSQPEEIDLPPFSADSRPPPNAEPAAERPLEDLFAVGRKRVSGMVVLAAVAAVAVVVALILLGAPWWSYLILVAVAIAITAVPLTRHARRRPWEFPAPEAAAAPAPPLPPMSSREVVLSVLRLAHDHGPLPLGILVAAGRRLGGPDRPSTVRDVLTQLGDDVVRDRPGTSAERVRIARVSPYDFAGTAARHGVVADSIEEVAPVKGAPRDTPEHAYAQANQAEHLWLAGRREEALRSLDDRPSDVPVENRERWTQWASRVGAELGDHRLTIFCRARVATWTGKSGDSAAALALLLQLVPTAESVLAPTDRELLSIHHNIAYQFLGLERFEEAKMRFEVLLDDSVSALGPDDRETIHVRHMVAIATGKCGDGNESLRLSRELLPDAERALGEDDEIVGNIQHNIIFWSAHGIAHPPPGILEIYRRLLDRTRRRLNDEHPDMLDLRFLGTILLAKDGQVTEALAEWTVQLGQAVEVLGERHPHVAKIREQLRFWRPAG